MIYLMKYLLQLPASNYMEATNIVHILEDMNAIILIIGLTMFNV